MMRCWELTAATLSNLGDTTSPALATGAGNVRVKANGIVVFVVAQIRAIVFVGLVRVILFCEGLHRNFLPVAHILHVM